MVHNDLDDESEEDGGVEIGSEDEKQTTYTSEEMLGLLEQHVVERPLGTFFVPNPVATLEARMGCTDVQAAGFLRGLAGSGMISLVGVGGIERAVLRGAPAQKKISIKPRAVRQMQNKPKLPRTAFKPELQTPENRIRRVREGKSPLRKKVAPSIHDMGKVLMERSREVCGQMVVRGPLLCLTKTLGAKDRSRFIRFLERLRDEGRLVALGDGWRTIALFPPQKEKKEG